MLLSEKVILPISLQIQRSIIVLIKSFMPCFPRGAYAPPFCAVQRL